MLLLTGGFPYSGKTEFSKTLLDLIENKLSLHIDPKSFIPNDIKGDLSIWQISAWELGYEKAENAIKRLPNKVLVIFDTAASKLSIMEPMIELAKEHGHAFIYVLIHADLNDRLPRTTNPDKLKELEPHYAGNLKDTIPILKDKSDKFVLVKNTSGNNGYKAIYNGAEKVTNFIKSIRS